MTEDPFIETKQFGLLVAVNTRGGTKKCKMHGGKIEVCFDTGITMYVPEALFKTMLFHLQEAD